MAATDLIIAIVTTGAATTIAGTLLGRLVGTPTSGPRSSGSAPKPYAGTPPTPWPKRPAPSLMSCAPN